MIETIKHYAKFIAALIGAAVVAFAGLIPSDWADWAQAIAAFLTAVSVVLVPNAPAPVEVVE